VAKILGDPCWESDTRNIFVQHRL